MSLPQECVAEDWVEWVSECGAAVVQLHLKKTDQSNPFFSLKVLEPRIRGATAPC